MAFADHRRGTRGGLLLLACALLGGASGCTDVTVHRVNGFDPLGAWRASAFEADGLSARTRQTLHQLDLDRAYHRDPARAFAQLQLLATDDPQADYLFALAETAFLLGQQAEKWKNPEAISYYYLCSGYAYHYLFPAAGPPDVAAARVDPAGPLTSYDPRFRLACDLYNAGLSKCIRAAQRDGRLDPGGELAIPGPLGQKLALSVVHHGFAWPPSDFGPFLFCADFTIQGLDNLYRGYGLGVPLIGTRQDASPATAHAFYPRDINFPVTAFFRFDGSLADLLARRCGRLELYNPLTVQAVDVPGKVVPLETDLTTPLAYFLSHTELAGAWVDGFFHADKIRNQTGIYMFEPYQPGKIPVLLVHGLASSPVTWAPLYNDLQADPVIRQRFQFWFYLYPTVNPYVATAADLRQSLDKLRAELDPEGRDPALGQMVVVGHSMGGLVSKLLTVDSGDDFWNLVSDRPLDQLKLKPDTRAELRRVFYFTREPYVRRVIYLATPHHGSELSPSVVGRLARQLVHLPGRFMQIARDIADENPGAWKALVGGQVPTSLDLLVPGSPALELVANRPRPEGVRYHSVIGVLPERGWLVNLLLPGGSSKQGTDGVVPYTSAHIDGVDSEVVVPTDHFRVHCHPRAVQEVRRILLDHLAAVGAGSEAGVVQAAAQVP